MTTIPPGTALNPESSLDTGNPDLVAAIRAEIDAAGGRIPFARFMELALYHPAWGYYLSPERRPGRPGDFLTAPETHPFFGITLARQVAECWERLGRPDPFVVREYGSGIGALAWDVIGGLSTEAPECRAALQYRLIETNPHRLKQSLAALAEGGLDDVVRGEHVSPGSDPEPITGVILANEVADAFGVHRLIWRNGTLREGWVIWSGNEFTEEEGDLSPEAAAADPEAMLREHGIALAEGDRIEISPAATAWFASVARGLRTRLHHRHRLRLPGGRAVRRPSPCRNRARLPWPHGERRPLCACRRAGSHRARRFQRPAPTPVKMPV